MLPNLLSRLALHQNVVQSLTLRLRTASTLRGINLCQIHLLLDNMLFFCLHRCQADLVVNFPSEFFTQMQRSATSTMVGHIRLIKNLVSPNPNRLSRIPGIIDFFIFYFFKLKIIEPFYILFHSYLLP